MRRIVLAFLVLCVTPLAFAEPAQNFSISGSARVRAESKNNGDFSNTGKDYTDFIGSRFRLDMKFNPSEKLNVFFQPQFTKVWGQSEYVPAGASTNTETGTSGGTRDPGLNVHQGYFAYSVSAPLALTVGRKELNYGDQLLVGGLGWSNVGRAFDLISLSYKHEMGSVETFNSKVKDNNVSTAGPGDREFSGVYSANKISDAIQSLDGYFFLSQDGSTVPTSKTHAYGIRAKSPVGPFDYRVEGTFEHVVDTSTESDEHQYDAEVGYSFLENRSIRLAVEYFKASSHFDQLFPTGHKWLGIADLFSRRNIKGFRVGLSGKLGEDLTVNLDFHKFDRDETSAPGYKYSGAAYGSTGEDSAMASEVDLVVAYKIQADLTLEAGAAQVTPDSYLKANGGSDVATFFYLAGTVSF